ncbi:hypothetical protein KI387_009795, partial [Taxus chinensis]
VEELVCIVAPIDVYDFHNCWSAQSGSFACSGCAHKLTASIARDVLKKGMISQLKFAGDDRIETVHISWNNESLESWVPRPTCSGKKDKGEIMIEVVVEKNVVKKRGDAWKIVFDACLPFISFLDLNRCMPYSIHELYKLLGISSAYQLTIQRLSVALEMVGKNVFKEHLLLVSDCIAYTGNIIGFNPAGYRDFYQFMDFPVPFTEGTLKVPIKCFGKAAQRGVKDTLSDAVASCSWGKRAPVGTGSNFDIVWHDIKEVKEPLELQHKQMDVGEFLEIVGMVPCTKVVPSSLCLGTDFDDPTLPCQDDSSEKNLTSTWDSEVRSPVHMDSWGGISENLRQLEVKELQDKGWNNPIRHEVKITGWNTDSNIEQTMKSNGDCMQSGWEHFQKRDSDLGWDNGREEIAEENKTNPTQNGWEQLEPVSEAYRGKHDGVSSLNKDSDTTEKRSDWGSGWGGLSNNQELLGAKELHTDGWNGNTENDQKVSGWGDDCNDGKFSSMENNSSLAHSTQVWEQNMEDIPQHEQARSVSLQFGYQRRDASSKFKPTGANTVPLGRKRPLTQASSEPLVKLDTSLQHTGQLEKSSEQKFQVQESSNNGWNPELSIKTVLESDWNSKQSIAVEAEPCLSQPSWGSFEESKNHAEDSNNDGWNPVKADTSFSQPSWGRPVSNVDVSKSEQISEATLKATEAGDGQGMGRGTGRGRSGGRARGGRDGGGRGRGRGDRAWDNDRNNKQSMTVETEPCLSQPSWGSSDQNKFHDGDSTNNGWSSGTMGSNIQAGSGSDWSSKQCLTVQSETCDSQPFGGPEQNKLLAEDLTNDGWNPKTPEPEIKTGFGSDWNNKQPMSEAEPWRCLPESQRSGRGGRDRGHRGRGDWGRGRGTRQFTSSANYPDLFVPREDEILQEVQPLMQSMRKILFRSSYQDGDRLTTEDEKEVTEKVLCHHPEKEAKIGSGIDYIMYMNAKSVQECYEFNKHILLGDVFQ